MCTPVHVNLEVWAETSRMKEYAVYSNESYSSGSVGYAGRSGVYTTVDFINDGLNSSKHSPTFGADFWRDYQRNEDLIGSLPVSALMGNPKYYPPPGTPCQDGSNGCLDSCSKSAACTAWEAQNKECMVVALMVEYYDRAYVEAVFANNGIPSYFCFLGYSGVQDYAVESQQQGTPVVFYHYEPDPFHVKHKNLFERVLLPRTTPEKSALSTATFGEHGYGGRTDNPVRVDFPYTSLEKYSASLLQDVALVDSLVSRMSLSELEINDLLTRYVNTSAAQPPEKDPMFSAACSWVRDNYPVWSLWLGRLPECSIYYYLAHDYIGCEENSTVFPRTVLSRWLVPNPENSSLPHNCDGGLLELPEPMVTSRSCEWLLANRVIWIFWMSRGRPVCDSTFYTYNVSGCDRAGSKREVQYHWLIPDPTDASKSVECTGGIALPESVLLDCEYVPYDAGAFTAVAVIAGILSSTLFVAMIFVFYYRDLPIIKRSQYQFLLVLLFGGILVCGAVWAYAGSPTKSICTTRSFGLAYGFTLIFGALLVKTLRVYRVFMSGAMKRVRLSAYTMFKILGVFVVIDFVILATWNIVDPPLPTTVEEETPELGGGVVERLHCASTSFIYTALLLFWKAILLFAGLYLSFLIRKVSSDFQESVWIFASSLVVLLTSLIILPMAYLVDLPAITFYLFFSFLLLGSTATVMALMIVPKIIRLHESSNDTTTTTTGGGSDTRASGGNTSSGTTNAGSGGKAVKGDGDMKSIIPGFRPSSDPKQKKSSRVSVTPVQQFTTNDS